MMSQLLLGASKKQTVSTLDMVDPFGDGSGIALYKFDGDATDESGVYNGTASNVTYSTGKFGQGIEGGSGKYVTVPINMTTHSMSCWFYLPSLSHSIKSLFSRCGSSYYGFGLDVFPNQVYVDVWSHNANTEFSVVSKPIIGWNHVYIYFDANGDGFIVLNGTKEIFNLGSIPFAYLTSNIVIGARINFYSTSYADTGTLTDQVRIFNRALTQEEIISLYTESVESYTPYVPPQGFFNDGTEVAYYAFDGDATDSTGNHSGTATNITYGTGKFGQCAVFNGSSSKIGSSIPSLSEVSISLWANMTDTTYSNGAYIFSLGYNSTNSIILSVNDLVQTLSLFANAGNYSQTTSSGIALNQFHHIVAIIQNSGIKLYLNDALVISGNTTISTPFPSNFELGYATTRNSTTSWFGGSIDQVRIFNRALTKEEVTALYNEGQ